MSVQSIIGATETVLIIIYSDLLSSSTGASSFNSRGASSFSKFSSLISGCSAFSSDKASSAKLGFLTSGILRVLFEGKIATPLFEIWPLYKFSKSSLVSSSTSSCCSFSSGSFRSLLIAFCSNSSTEILPSPISLREIIVLLSLSFSTKSRTTRN